MTDITFFSSPTGLGHVSRDIAIAQLIDANSTKFVSGNAAAQFLVDNGFDAQDLYTPPKFNVSNGKLENPLKWLWNYYNYYKECKKISSSIIEKEKPRIVISDEDFEKRKNEIIDKDDVILRTKESLHYYEIFRKLFGSPADDKAENRCPYCKHNVENSKFCRMCGSYPI